MNFINIEQPLVSIIMACYNSIKTIDESISSVINQDYKNFELIIADDNSTDGTYEFIISKYSSSDKVKIIRNE
ncbi:glycosyltransferase family 2 protein, partial [Escherichia coli]